MNIRSDELELRGLMLAGLDGDAAAHKALLTRLSANLRAYFKTHLARIGVSVRSEPACEVWSGGLR